MRREDVERGNRTGILNKRDNSVKNGVRMWRKNFSRGWSGKAQRMQRQYCEEMQRTWKNNLDRERRAKSEIK